LRNLFPVIFAIILIVIFGLLQIIFFKYFNRQWWRKKLIKVTSWLLPSVGIISVVIWGYGEYYTVDWLAYPGAILAVLTFILEFSLFLSLPISGIFHLINWIFDKISSKKIKKEHEAINQKRRLILKSAAAAVPIITLSAGAAGVAGALGEVNVYRRKLTIDNLPDSLHGLKIFHLSDIHLRHYVTLDDLEEVLKQSEPFAPDITLITGDIADDLRLLPDALKMIAQLKTSLGAYAVLGNHEYFRGISDVMNIFSKSPVALLKDTGIRLSRKNTPIFIGGIDDPRHMGPKEYDFFKKTVGKVMTETNSDDFVILMSHRPDALDYSAEVNIPLILAGHTHGGQIGLNDRSLFESFFPGRYLWGDYRIKDSHLYTSSGVEHWFPYRLGCPPEAPVIELVKG